MKIGPPDACGFENSRPEAVAIFGRSKEGLDHLGLYKIAVEFVQFVHPGVISIKVSIGRVAGVNPFGHAAMLSASAGNSRANF
jgi:hypothetical protein